MDDRITVLAVVDSLGVGGAQALMPTFLRHVDRDRFDVCILALGSAPANHVQADVIESGISLTQWSGRRLLSLPRVRAIVHAIEAHNADVVHTHLLYSNVQAALAARLAGRPIVATLHNVHQFSPFVKRKLETGVLRMTRARALAVSDGVRRSYCGPLGLTTQQTTVIPNAIDLHRFSVLDPADVERVRVEALDGAAGPLVVAVGRITTQKGFATLVKAAATVHARLPEARFVIAGRDSGGQPEVVAEIESLGLSGVVRLLGQRVDVPQLLAAADCYVSPSLTEGAPVAHLEAMAAGAPVVATSVGGVPEIIRDGFNGLLVPAGKSAPLAEALLRLAEDRELACRVSANGKMAVREFGADIWARRIEHEYLRVLDNQGADCREVGR